MRIAFFVLAAAPLLFVTGCGDAIARGFSEQEAPRSYSAVVDAGSLPSDPTNELPRYPAEHPEAPGTYQVSGTVTGLASTLVLQNNGGDDLTFVDDTHFTFPVRIVAGQPFDVSVKAQPAHQTCTVREGHGIVGSANITDVSVECGAVTFPVGGIVSNLHGTVVLRIGDDSVTVVHDGVFTFGKALPPGSTYDVEVTSQPDGQQCVVSRATNGGIVGGEDVTSLVVGCTDFVNASFENGFTGWTLTRDAVDDSYGGAATISAGTTLTVGDTIHELISDADLTLGYPSPALPTTFIPNATSISVALFCAANGPTRIKTSQDVTLSSAVTGLSFDFQYASGASPDDVHQYVRVQLLDPTTNAVLATLTSVGTGSDATSIPGTITGDVSAYAGQTVRVQVEAYGFDGPIYAAFDSFTLH